MHRKLRGLCIICSLVAVWVVGCDDSGESPAPDSGAADVESTDTVDTSSEDAAADAGDPDGGSNAGTDTNAGDAGEDADAQGPSTCIDGVDNDGDGWTDWHTDLGCANQNDDDETAAPRPEENGFTTFDPPASGTVLFVSSSEGDDSNDGTNPETPLETIAAASSNLQDGAGAWILLRRGDVFEEDLDLSEVHGAGPDDRVVFASYGDSTERPVLRDHRIHGTGSFNHVAVVGITVSGRGRNPDSSHYVGPDSPAGLRIVGTGGDILVESCRLTYGQSTIQGYQGVIRDVQYRRNVVYKSYSVDSHAQGLFAGHLEGLTVEGNVFDHNGWLVQQRNGGQDQADGQATIFNHNIYVASTPDVAVRRNMFLRASSIGTKFRADEPGASTNVRVENNLFYEGEVGISIGGNTDKADRFVDAKLLDNVFVHVGRAQPTNRTLAWALGVKGNDGIEVARNYILHQDKPSVGNSFGIHLQSTLRDAHVHDNVLYRLLGRGLQVDVGSTFENVVVEDNVVDLDNLDAYVVQHRGGFGSITYRNNEYATGRSSDSWFRIDGSGHSFQEWISTSGDTGSSDSVPSHPDPSRDLATYNASLGGTESSEAFIEDARARNRWSWDADYTAPSANAYLKAGFR